MTTGIAELAAERCSLAEVGLCEGLSVTMICDLPEEERISMNRFGVEFALALRQVTAADITALPSEARSKWWFRTSNRHLTRFVSYPVQVRRHPADVFHILDQGYGDIAIALPHERVVVTCHDLMLRRAAAGKADFPAPRLAAMRFRYSTSFLRRVARVVCVSDATRDDVINLTGVAPERVAVVPLGVHRRFRRIPQADREELRAQTRKHREQRIALHVSSGNPYKNVPATLEAVARVRRSGCDLQLVRVGRPLGLEDRGLAQRLGIADSIVDRGFVPDDELVRLYNAADLLLFPSLWEGFGWPVLEAMACGLPVVCSTADALRELAGDGALYAEANDVERFAALAMTIFDSAEAADRAATAGLMRAESFSWAATATQYGRIFEQVAKEAE